jgi:transcriptional regulator with XRE-family HTH domain
MSRCEDQSQNRLSTRKILQTIGDHIRKKRLDIGLLQSDVAERIGVSEATIYNWERNANSPQVHDIPAIILFLGYNPLPAAKSLGKKLLWARRKLGLTQRTMAERLGIDPTTLARLERGIGKQSRKQLEIANTAFRNP